MNPKLPARNIKDVADITVGLHPIHSRMGTATFSTIFIL